MLWSENTINCDSVFFSFNSGVSFISECLSKQSPVFTNLLFLLIEKLSSSNQKHEGEICVSEGCLLKNQLLG